MARPKISLSANQVRSVVSKYNKSVGLVTLADEFGYSIPVIRRALRDSKVRIRGRGRPAAV